MERDNGSGMSVVRSKRLYSGKNGGGAMSVVMELELSCDNPKDRIAKLGEKCEGAAAAWCEGERWTYMREVIGDLNPTKELYKAAWTRVREAFLERFDRKKESGEVAISLETMRMGDRDSVEGVLAKVQEMISTCEGSEMFTERWLTKWLKEAIVESTYCMCVAIVANERKDDEPLLKCWGRVLEEKKQIGHDIWIRKMRSREWHEERPNKRQRVGGVTESNGYRGTGLSHGTYGGQVVKQWNRSSGVRMAQHNRGGAFMRGGASGYGGQTRNRGGYGGSVGRGGGPRSGGFGMDQQSKDWVCPIATCGYMNFGKNERCKQCQKGMRPDVWKRMRQGGGGDRTVNRIAHAIGRAKGMNRDYLVRNP
ncbi:MAG: hypothetical protein JW779_10315 [Candidatus Thorarchaeota archaeon]|nr:hypothetical protein [Candidatus Thorarchaeota archaeon]